MQEFKLIVAGGRYFTNAELMAQSIIHLANGVYADKAVSIVTGMAKGAGSLGYLFAIKHNVAKHRFPADWNQYDESADMLRNKQMGDFADGLLAFWNKSSKGTEHMIEYMRSLGKPVHIVRY